jgi:anti-anti-sigma factor
MPPSQQESQPAATLAGQVEAARVELRELAGNTAVVTLAGEHDLFTKGLLEAALREARTASTVIVDLTPCTFIDSTIIATLLAVRHARAHVQRIELAVPATARAVHRALELTGVPAFFATHATLAAALANAEPAAANA